MTKHRVNAFFILPILFITASILYSFSIFTNSSGYARRYVDSDIPFSYQLNNSTPSNYFNAIHAGAQVWEDVVSSYWEFEYGGLTPNSTDNFDGVNLVFFDFQGVNFPVGTNAIAYSRTWTTGGGSSYRAVESDLIWNARDFPPSPTGQSGQQDLQSVIAHEFGHHLGLGHAGPAGGPPGVGPLIPEATMYGFSSNGDTTKRSLHIDDIAGVSAIYPVWKLDGTVTDASSGAAFADVAVTAPDIFASVVDPPLFGNNIYQRPGYYEDRIITDQNGEYEAFILLQQVDLTVKYFGYQNETAQVSFNPPGGIGSTQSITLDFQMHPSPISSISGVIVDSLTGSPIQAQIAVWATSDKPGVPAGTIADTTTGGGGDYHIDLPAGEDYRMVVIPQAPYPERTVNVENLSPAGLTLNFDFEPAEVLLVNDDLSEDYEAIYQNTLDEFGVAYHRWRVSEKGIPDTAIYARFPAPRITIWYTGDATNNALTNDEQQSLADFLDAGGRLLLTGQNIAETGSGGVLLSNYLGVGFQANIASPIVQGVAGDPIGEGLVLSTVGGAGNQTSKDALSIGAGADSSFYYGTSTSLGVAGLRAEDQQAGWKAVFLGFGLEGVNNNNGLRDTLVRRTLNWFDIVTAIENEPLSGASMLPQQFELRQNYPNPFNPQTTIQFSVAERTRVQIDIFNALGQRVKTLVDMEYSPGNYEAIWRGRTDTGSPVSSGVYFYRMSAGNGFQSSKKLLLIK